MRPATRSRRHPSARPLVFLALAGAMLLLALGAASAQELPAEPASEGGLAPVAFLEGIWRGSLSGGVIEEQWSGPEGDNMMGMFRYVKDGKVTFYEMQVIELGDAGPVLRIKHYHPGLRGWEEKDESVTFGLQEVADQKAVFLEDDGSQTLTYEVIDDRLTIELARVGAEKPSSRFEFERRP